MTLSLPNLYVPYIQIGIICIKMGKNTIAGLPII